PRPRAIANSNVTAKNPLCSGRHANLVTHTVITYRCPSGVRPVKVVVARKRRIVTTRVAYAIVDGVVPIEIVISVHSVPAAIVRLKRVMRPSDTSISTGYNNVLPDVTERPH